MGRDKKNENRVGQYAALPRSTLETPAWRALPAVAMAAYPFVKLEYKGSERNNNGRIRISVRQLGLRLGVSKDTAAKALHALQAKGFLRVTEGAHLGVEGYGKGPSFEITEIALPPNGRPSRLFKEWRDGEDFEVVKAVANNPNGRRGKR